ncbi:MAG: hypothetical protein AAFP84_02060 [Actinomycetota bacterium]
MLTSLLVRRVLTALAIALAAMLPSDVAFADPAGPTDYLTEVVSIEPPTDVVDVRILGGDSFVELVVTPGTEVLVNGYEREPYLWFRADGAVVENANSPTTYQNAERYGADAPPRADADAAPDWVTVSDDGSYAWHDHRAHWMQPIRPAGKQAGDQILEAVIPLVVDGSEVDVTVISTWQPAPSTLPAVTGGMIGGVAALAAWWWSRRRSGWNAVALPIAVAAVVAGAIRYLSLPSETGTPTTTWLTPAVAVAALLGGAILGRRDRFMADAAAVLGGVALLIWAGLERDALRAAIIPTDAPAWFHRTSIISAAVLGAGLVAVGAARVVRQLTPTDRAGSGGIGSVETVGNS